MTTDTVRKLCAIAALILAVAEVAIAGPRFGIEVAIVLLAIAALLG
jgi:hypothetical protein